MNPLSGLKRAIALCTGALGILASITFCTPPPTAPVTAVPPWSLTGWNFAQFQPPIPPGGRANTIAVRPTDGLILVASESGGLFRSTDGGDKWQHVDSLPVFYTNAVAFAKNNVVIVTANEDFSVSNRGGIWRSDNGGESWTQVPSPSPSLWFWTLATATPTATATPLPVPFNAYEISIAPDTGNIYVATSYGVSIGDPEGKTWQHVVPTAPDFFADRRMVSLVALPKTAQGNGDLVLAGGPAGIRRSVDGGASWHEPTTKPSPDAIGDIHAFGRRPVVKDQAFVVVPVKLSEAEQKAKNLTCSQPGACTYMMLYSTTDGGDTWNQLYTAPDDTCRDADGCAGGIGGVKAVGDTTSFDLYFSNRLLIYHRPWGGSWKPFIKFRATSEAGDTRDIVFNSQNQPILAATDGGLIKHNGLPQPPSVADIQKALKNLGDYSGAITGTANDATQKAVTKYQSDHELKPTGIIDQPTIDSLASLWTFVGANNQGNGPNGYNALQVYQVTGQWVGNSQHNLYFGTQDNAIWSSGDTGNTWTRCCNEGGNFESEYRVASSSDSQITFYTGGGHNWKLQGLLFTCAPNDSTNCSGGKVELKFPDCQNCGKPKIISKNFHVQGVNSVTDVTNPTKFLWLKGLAVTYNFGTDWEQYARFWDDRRDLPKRSFVEPGGAPVLYQAIKTGGWDSNKGEIIHLVRIDNKQNVFDPVLQPLQMNNLGGIGRGSAMNAVFDVDPGNVEHLIAADIVFDNMKETTDGGKTWAEIPQLTSLIRDGGKLNFSGRIYRSPFSSDEASVSQASAISFCPDSPNAVAVGTVQNGIFISTEHGKDGTWTKVPGSEQATLISSLHWRKANDIIVSTYGRGLWRVKFTYVGPVLAMPCNSPDCIQIYYERPPGTQPSPYDQAVVAVGGPVEGARVAHGVLEELYIRPSTMVAFATDLKQLPDIKVTETTRPVRFEGISRMPRPPKEGWIITGLTFKKRGERSELVGFLFSPKPRSMYIPEERGEAEKTPVGQEQPPSEQKPYLEVASDPVTPGATIQLSGRGLPPGSKIEIAVDRKTVQRLVADRQGKFSAAVQAPSQFGFHSLTLIDSASKKVLDGAMISVSPNDNR
jgi:Putative peptidoglycan binding domain